MLMIDSELPRLLRQLSRAENSGDPRHVLAACQRAEDVQDDLGALPAGVAARFDAAGARAREQLAADHTLNPASTFA